MRKDFESASKIMDPKMKTERVDELLAKFVESVINNKINEKRSTTMSTSSGSTENSTKHHWTYGDVCTHYQHRWFDEESNDFVDALVTASYITKKHMKKTETKQLGGPVSPRRLTSRTSTRAGSTRP